MQLIGAASTALRSVYAGPPRPARLLGARPAAAYLAVEGQPGVIAVLAHDAVRLPCAVVLPNTSGELPLTGLMRAPCTVGDGRVRWQGGQIAIVREWVPAVVRAGSAASRPTRQARALLGMAPADVFAADHLLGSGPGLTPRGDDVLVGYLVGARAFELDVTDLSRAVAALAPARTTALSTALLWHAVRGECIPDLAALAGALAGRGDAEVAVRKLAAVGHTSGTAMAWGMVSAAGRAMESEALDEH